MRLRQRIDAGEYTGTAEFFIDTEKSIVGKLMGSDCGNNMEQMKAGIVDIITIEDFVESERLERVDYIKADIEGGERDMLKGAMRTLRKFSPKLSLREYHLKDDPEVLERLILYANPNYVLDTNIRKYTLMYRNKKFYYN